jgi:hypothetical protein
VMGVTLLATLAILDWAATRGHAEAVTDTA